MNRIALITLSFAIPSALLIGCGTGTPSNTSIQDSANEAAPVDPQVEVEGLSPLDGGFSPDEAAVTEQEAWSIASASLGGGFRPTSAVFGPEELDDGSVVPIWLVSVNDGAVLFEVAVDADTGEVLKTLPRMTLQEGAPIDDSGMPVHYSYYTYCPAGWMCMKTPSSIGFYSQNDPSWACNYLGNSTYYTLGDGTYGAKCSHAMHSSGCLMSAYAMQLLAKGYSSYKPSDLNTFAKSKGCFSAGSALINTTCLASALGRTYSTISTSAIWSTVAGGTPVVAYGTSSVWGTSHAQMIWGHDGARYWTKDPWYDWTNQDQALSLVSASYRIFK